eukprot:10893-Eustigmatos_ZCMA.PRE.1
MAYTLQVTTVPWRYSMVVRCHTYPFFTLCYMCDPRAASGPCNEHATRLIAPNYTVLWRE